MQTPPDEFLALVERAKKAEESSAPRQHHLVPASYLRRWTEDSRLKVVEVDSGRNWTTSAEKAARERDYYRLESTDIDPEEVPPLLFETLLGETESWAKTTIDQLLASQPRDVDPKDLARFTWYLGFQSTRGQSFRKQLAMMAGDAMKLRARGWTDGTIRAQLKSNGLPHSDQDVEESRQGLEAVADGRLRASLSREALVGLAASQAFESGAALLERDWAVVRTPAKLLTCDEPVIRIGGPGTKREERAGLGTAGVVIFPLAPTAVLVMSRSGVVEPSETLTAKETRQLNREIVATSHRWAFEGPKQTIAEELKLPVAPVPFQREGPFPHAGPRGGEVYRLFSPTRWANAEESPPWPVAKWWKK